MQADIEALPSMLLFGGCGDDDLESWSLSADFAGGFAVSAQPVLRGRIDIIPLHIPGRPGLAGRQPPHGGGRYGTPKPKRLSTKRRRGSSPRVSGALGICALTSALSLGPAHAADAFIPDLNGVYRCEGSEAACERFGSPVQVTQSGSELQIRSGKVDSAKAKLTSSATLTTGPALNMFGIVRSDDGVIVWSNGATWRKQQLAKDSGRSS
jgi:hypothetical protein